jgi:hypothetical protein
VVVTYNTGNLVLQSWTPVGHTEYFMYQQNMETWDELCHRILGAATYERYDSDEHQQTKNSEYVYVEYLLWIQELKFCLITY